MLIAISFFRQKAYRFVWKHQRYRADCCLHHQAMVGPQDEGSKLFRNAGTYTPFYRPAVLRHQSRPKLLPRLQHTMHWSNTSTTLALVGRGGGVWRCWYMWQRRLLGNGSQLTETWKKKNASRFFTAATRRRIRGAKGRDAVDVRKGGGEWDNRGRERERERCVEPHPM